MDIMRSACKIDYLSIVQKLMRNVKNEELKIELMKIGFLSACRYGSLESAYYLVNECKCNIHVKDQQGKSGIMWACFGGHLKMVQFCVKIGCNIFEQNISDGYSPFIYACGSTEISIVKYLMKNFEINLEEKDAQGRTALFHTIRTHHMPIKQYLLKPKTHLELVEFLVGENCDLSTRDITGKGAVDIAYEKMNIKVMIFLLEFGCVLRNENIISKKKKIFYEAIEKRIQFIEECKQIMENAFPDMDLLLVELICEFSFGLQNLKNTIQEEEKFVCTVF